MSVNKYNGTELINIAGKGQSITVDSALSTTSTNPVQNKVVKSALDEKDTAISNVAQKVSNNDDAYSSTKAYAVGDLCIYNNTLYRCTTACSAGSWATNQSCFTADTLVSAIDKLNTITTNSIRNTLYGVVAYYTKKNNIVTMSVLCNDLLTALPYNQWTSLIPNIPMSPSPLQYTSITFNNNIVSFLLSDNSSDLKIICRTPSGIPVHDGFSVIISYICN